MRASTFKTRVSVKIWTVREKKMIDLTGSVRSINIQKGLDRPSGNWMISLSPTLDSAGFSWYHRIAPMDYVEISFCRHPHRNEAVTGRNQGVIPVVMRGFVDHVGRTLSVDGEGRPIRTFSISGRDFGKVLEIAAVYFLKEVHSEVQIIKFPGAAGFREKYNLMVSGSPAEILKDVFDIALHQLSLIQTGIPAVPTMKARLSPAIEGAVHTFSLTQQDGSVWDLMQSFDNRPWNELYVTDRYGDPTLVFRKTPWKDPEDGSLIQGDDPVYDSDILKPVEIDKGSVLQLDLGRGDSETRNYFFTFPVQQLLQVQQAFKAQVTQEARTEDDLRANPYFVKRDDISAGIDRFGFRRFENSCEFMGAAHTDPGTVKLAEKLNLALARAFARNTDYESGTLVVKGDERIHPGCYVKFMGRAGVTLVKPEFYVQQVEHELNLVAGSESFTTTMEVVRGTGFIETERLLSQGDAKLEKAIT